MGLESAEDSQHQRGLRGLVQPSWLGLVFIGDLRGRGEELSDPLRTIRSGCKERGVNACGSRMGDRGAETNAACGK